MHTFRTHTHTHHRSPLKFKFQCFISATKSLLRTFCLAILFRIFFWDLYGFYFDFCSIWPMICSFLFDSNNNSSNNKRYSFLTFQWGKMRKNLFTCAIWNVNFFFFFRYFFRSWLVIVFCFLRILPLALRIHFPNCLVGKDLNVLHLWFYKHCVVSEPIALFMHIVFFHFFEIFLAFKWCSILNAYKKMVRIFIHFHSYEVHIQNKKNKRIFSSKKELLSSPTISEMFFFFS